MKRFYALLTLGLMLFVLYSCSDSHVEEPQFYFDEMTFSVDEFPCYDADSRAVGTYDAGKTDWEEGDQLLLVAETGAYATLTRKADGVWTTRDATSGFNADSKIVVTYAPNCEIVDGQVTPRADKPFGLAEYFSTEATFDETQVSISFLGVERAYSRVRIATTALQTITVDVTAFTPAGAAATRAEEGSYSYELTTDEKGNGYLYGLFAAGATIRTGFGENVLTERTLASATKAGKSYSLNSIPETIQMPAGATFNAALTEVLGACTSIKFVAESQQISDQVLFTDENGSKAYAVANGDCLEIHAPVGRFVANADCSRLFYDHLQTITAIDFNGCFDTSNVTDMSNMFIYCTHLASLDVSGFDTSKVTGMRSMFYSCSSLTSLDVSGFDTSNVTNMSMMFMNCSKLATLDVSGFDTSNVTNMRMMFDYCKALATLDVSGFNTSKVTDMREMFDQCQGLTLLDVSGFDTSNVTNMSSMFVLCFNLTSLDVSGFDTSKVTDMHSMFSNCSKLTTLDVSGFDTSNVTLINAMFLNCSKLTTLDVSGFDTSNITDMSAMFSGCSSLTSLDLSRFTFTANPTVRNMFSGFGAAIPVTITQTGYDYMNAQGNCGILDSNSWFEVDGVKIQPEGYILLGDAMYTDDLVASTYGVDPVEYSVQVYTHTRKPGYILLKNAYTKRFPYNGSATYPSEDTYFEIDISDPSAVVVPEQELGLDMGQGVISVVSAAPGSMVDNVITFPANKIYISMANYNNGNWMYGNVNGMFRVVLP